MPDCLQKGFLGSEMTTTSRFSKCYMAYQEQKEFAEKKLKSAEYDASSAYAGYESIRKSVYDTFRRDIFETSYPGDIISEGNISGDVEYDAILFAEKKLGTRGNEDQQVFKSLYGITVERALELREMGDVKTPEVLNRHATLVARIANCLSKETYKEWKIIFAEFIDISNSNPTLRPLDKNTTALSNAYYHLSRFQACALQESDDRRRVAASAARGGDIYYDVSLFAKGILGYNGDEDEKKFLMLYGISVERACELKAIGNRYTHNALNEHATLVAKVENYLPKEMVKEWEAAFAVFIETSNANRTLAPYDENATTLTKAFERLIAVQGGALGLSNIRHEAAEWKRRNAAGTDATRNE